MLPIWIDFGSLPVAELIPFIITGFMILTVMTMGFVGRT